MFPYQSLLLTCMQRSDEVQKYVFYTNVFICTITQFFPVSRCPCPTKQLTTHYPIGFKLHHISILLQLKQSAIHWLYTEDLGLQKHGENHHKTYILKIRNTLLLIQLRVFVYFALWFPVGHKRGKLSISCSGTPCEFKIMQQSHVFTQS